MHVMHVSSIISYDSYLAHAYFRCTLLCSHPCSSLLHSSLWLCGKHLTWVRASWPLTHGQAGSRWQRGAGCSTSRSSVATCNATERAASAFSCWLCFLFFSKESPPSLDFDLRLRSFDGSSRVLFYVDPVVLSLHGIIPRPLWPLRRHFFVPLRHHRPPLRRRPRLAPTSVATSRWLRFLYYLTITQVSVPLALVRGHLTTPPRVVSARRFYPFPTCFPTTPPLF